VIVGLIHGVIEELLESVDDILDILAEFLRLVGRLGPKDQPQLELGHQRVALEHHRPGLHVFLDPLLQLLDSLVAVRRGEAKPTGEGRVVAVAITHGAGIASRQLAVELGHGREIARETLVAVVVEAPGEGLQRREPADEPYGHAVDLRHRRRGRVAAILAALQHAADLVEVLRLVVDRFEMLGLWEPLEPLESDHEEAVHAVVVLEVQPVPVELLAVAFVERATAAKRTGVARLTQGMGAEIAVPDRPDHVPAPAEHRVAAPEDLGRGIL